MNLVGTLAKVAIGVMVARGVGSLMSGSKSAAPTQGGGLGGLLGGLTGGNSQQSGSTGGLGDLLGGLTGSAQKPQANGDFGGLGGLLGSLSGGNSVGVGRQAENSAGNNQQSAGGSGGLGDLLGGLTGGNGQQGGLGGILGNLLAGGAAQNASQPAMQAQPAPMGGGLGGLLDSFSNGTSHGDTSLGGMFNQALSGGQTPAPEPHHNQQAEILLRAMINAAKSDGAIDQEEQQMILEHLRDASPEEIAFVQNEIAGPLDFEGFVRSVPEGLKHQAYLMSLLGIKLDSQAEALYLDRLATGLGISQAESNDIHNQVGVPPLYA